MEELTQRAADVETNLEELQFLDQQSAHVRSTQSTYPSNDNEPVIEVEANAQDMSGKQAQREEDGGEHNGNSGSNDQLMSATTVVLRLAGRRSGSRHDVRSFL